ncbi:unnamed protein product [Tenebrio molitor]|nr:unnamed protein product [Tenebrio molitor]
MKSQINQKLPELRSQTGIINPVFKNCKRSTMHCKMNISRLKLRCPEFISDLPILEEEVKALRESNKINQDQLELLTKNEQKLIEEKIEVLQENNTLKNELSKSVKDYQMLKNHHEAIENENKENQSRLKSLQEALNASELAVTCLKEKCASLDFATQQLKRDLEEHENLRRSLHNTIQDMKGNIRVFCRVRPPIDNEEIEKQQCSIFFPSETTLEIRKSRESVSVTGGKNMDLKQEFNFDKVFPPEANQTEVFEELSQLVQSALDGYHVCVFAYGQTGSGKTYTMQGSTHDHGMIPRTIDLIFDKIDKLAIGDWTYTVMASFLEIYNENVKDLLSPNSTHNYELRYNEGRGVTVTNLQIVHIASAAELKTLMEEAHKNRAVAATDFNEHSSRSHAVTKIHLEGYHKNSKTKYAGSVNLVDLAGSESAKTSAAERLNETKSINKSLSTLGSVMLALHNKDSHVPYRNSKLTFLLQSCLGGNSKTLMFVNISPFEECFYESINSLRFAAKVKDIKINAKRNKTYGMMTPLQTKH